MISSDLQFLPIDHRLLTNDRMNCLVGVMKLLLYALRKGIY